MNWVKFYGEGNLRGAPPSMIETIVKAEQEPLDGGYVQMTDSMLDDYKNQHAETWGVWLAAQPVEVNE